MGRALGRSAGYHVLVAGVLLIAAIGGVFGTLLGSNMFDPSASQSGTDEFNPALHPTTAGYIGEVVVAALPVLVISLLAIPLLRRAGSPAPRIAALGFASIPIVAFTLGTIDEAIRDRQPWGCCLGPGLTGPWWTIWVVGAMLIAVVSVAGSAYACYRVTTTAS